MIQNTDLHEHMLVWENTYTLRVFKKEELGPPHILVACKGLVFTMENEEGLNQK
jgi:hypothetical protein